MIPASLPPLANHLWQSTLFAGVAGLLTLALLRKSPARVRPGFWLAASWTFRVRFAAHRARQSHPMAHPTSSNVNQLLRHGARG
jgi:hypothetical protein